MRFCSVRKWAFICVLLFCGLICVSSCAEPTLYDDDGNIRLQKPPEPTDRLVVYLPLTYKSGYIDEVSAPLRKALDLFGQQFPDVAVECVEWNADEPNAYENYRQRLLTDIMAGKGPDLIVFSDRDFQDLQKVMASGAFYNIDNFLSVDASFDTTVYQQAVWNGGYYKQQRLLIPLNYRHFSVLTSDEALQDAGIQLSAQPDFSEWSRQIQRYVAAHSIQENRNLFLSWRDLYSHLFLNNLGLSVLDYENKQVLLQPEDLRAYMDFYKAVYPSLIQDWDGTVPDQYAMNLQVYEALQNKRLLFFSDYTHLWFLNEAKLEMEPTVTPRTFYLPTPADVQPYATAEFMAAIRASSPNKANAYELLKILLSLGPQSSFFIPVHNEALRYNLLTDRSDFSKDEIEARLQDLNALEFTMPLENAVVTMMHSTMLPWVNNEKSYEACFEELRERLALYLYE